MIVTTIDPVTGEKVTDLDHHPFIIEGAGVAAMKICFESDDTRRVHSDSPDDTTEWDAADDAPRYF